MICFKSTMERFLNLKDLHVKTLESQVRRLEEELKAERIRAERAIDQLLAQKNIPAVSAPAPRQEKDSAAIERAKRFRKVMSHIGGEIEGTDD